MTNATSVAPRRAHHHRLTSDGFEPSPYSIAQTWRHGDIPTRLSFIIFGLGNLARKQIAKGLVFLACEIGIVYYLATTGAKYLSKIVSLGDTKQTKVKVDGFWTYQAGDNSVQILLYAVMSLFVVALLIVLAALSAKSSYKTQLVVQEGNKPASFISEVRELGNLNAHVGLMFLPTLGIVVFTILPLVFMISMAFTNYDKNHVVLFDWVGVEEFRYDFQLNRQRCHRQNVSFRAHMDLGVGILRHIPELLPWHVHGDAHQSSYHKIQGILACMLLNVHSRAAIRVPTRHAHHVATRWRHQSSAAQRRAHRQSLAVPHRCDMGTRHRHRHQSVGRHPIHHHANHRYSAERSDGSL
jgi:hypothetical protein